MDKIDTSTAAISALMDGVTEGPWELRGKQTIGAGVSTVAKCGWKNGRKDAPFIAASHQLVQALAAERDAAVMRAEQAEAKLGEWKKSQHYTYVGKNGMPVLARDLEDRLENAEARTISRIVTLIKSPSVMYPNGMVDMPADELCDIISQALSDGIGGENGND